jgi:hypothetical protein
MTFIWLVVWLFSHTPEVAAFGSWNNWGIALVICMFLDVIGALSASGWRRQRIYFHAGDATWSPGSGWKHGEPDPK